jgi:hypothetical protein
MMSGQLVDLIGVWNCTNMPPMMIWVWAPTEGPAPNGVTLGAPPT